jgi:hypothetical protein
MYPKFPKIIFTSGIVVGIILCLIVNGLRGCGKRVRETHAPEPEPEIIAPVVLGAVRDAPAEFKRNTYLPNVRENVASGSNIPRTFSPGRDLVYIDDPRVWWKSDNRAANETNDDCSHTMHKSMVEPFMRLANLASETKWTLKVQGIYSSDGGVHNVNTLHKQGRAIDLTFGDPANPTERLDNAQMNIAYEVLAKLAYQAGFDWVFYEQTTGTGPHSHASVRADRNNDLPPATVK